MQIRPGVELANLTDVGCERENNEDYFCYWEPQSEEEFRRKGRLAVVADGMGGAEGGEIASRLAVDAVRAAYLQQPDGDPETSLVEAFRAAHEAILDFVKQRPELRGMGTTCTAVAITRGKAHFAHIGDSRLYLIRGGSVRLLTHDHTAISRLVEQGIIGAGEAAGHPQAHVLTAALGASKEVAADFSQAGIPLEPGDILILCTDGLWGQISDSELCAAATDHSPSQACRELIRMAKARGGPDNITVQILRVSADGSSPVWSDGAR
jgi:serine/threonine protein phosphatase PrpC